MRDRATIKKVLRFIRPHGGLVALMLLLASRNSSLYLIRTDSHRKSSRPDRGTRADLRPKTEPDFGSARCGNRGHCGGAVADEPSDKPGDLPGGSGCAGSGFFASSEGSG